MEMTFEDKFASCVRNFEDEIKPDYTSTELNYYADFVELVSLFSGQEGITLGDIQDRFFGEKSYDNASSRDTDEKLLINIFIIIEERLQLYSDDYPFQYQDNEILQIKEVLTTKNKLYISLLISSKLNLFKEFKDTLTVDFETISSNVLKEFLPQKAIVKDFGKRSAYSGNAQEKIRSLARDLYLDIDEHELSCVNERNYQERGLDIIGWIPFGDKCKNQIIFLVQCACGKEFESKQHDTRRFENYLVFYKTKPQHTLFVPYSLINTYKSKFYHSDLIEREYLVFERKRIIELYSDDFFEHSESVKIVEKLINYRA